MGGPVYTGANVSNPGSSVSISTALGNLAQGLPNVNALPANNVSIQFPSDINTSFMMKLQFANYQRPGISSNVTLPPIGAVYLPIPDGLTDSQGVTWATTNTDQAVGAAMQSLSGGGSAAAVVGSAAAGVVAEAGLGLASKGAAAVNSALGTKLSSDNAVNQLLQYGGYALNPFLTVLFQQPNFRDFSFTWKLAPRRASDSQVLASIIASIKNFMLPSGPIGPGGLLLGYPSICTPTLVPQFGFKFKPCVIENMTVNYAPGATPSFFYDSTPTVVYLTVQLKEIEFWLQTASGAS